MTRIERIIIAGMIASAMASYGLVIWAAARTGG